MDILVPNKVEHLLQAEAGIKAVIGTTNFVRASPRIYSSQTFIEFARSIM
jgi:hypothetical protein